MTRLLWKEHRESWPYGLALCICSLFTVLIGTAYTFLGSSYMKSGWSLLPVVISMVYGSVSLSREKENKTLGFVICHSINPDKLVLAKAVVAILYSTVAAVVSLIAYLIMCRPEYRPFLTVHQLGYGLWTAIEITVFSWFFGFGLSIYPRVEHNMHVLLWANLVTIVGSRTMAFIWTFMWLPRTQLILPFVVYLLHRHDHWQPKIRQLVIGVIVAVLLSYIALYTELGYQDYKYNKYNNTLLYSVSPDGNKALYEVYVTNSEHGAPAKYWQIVDINKKSVRYQCLAPDLDSPWGYRPKRWIDNDTVIISVVQAKHAPSMRIVSMGGELHNRTVDIPNSLDEQNEEIIPSSGGNYVIYSTQARRHDELLPMRILDVRHGKWLTEPIKVSNCWWQSDHSVGYIDDAGKRRILPLPGGKGQ